MMHSLYQEKGATFRIDIMTDPAVRDFIGAHASTLDDSFSRVEMSDRMRRRLSRSNYIFSGIKTFHELNEAFPSLLDENGERKPFERFLNDVRKIDSTYNANYLRAEYNFVNASARAAAKWESFAEDGDRYNLQYRTQSDDKVRPEHAALNRVTLPPSDPFWESYYPPNGWNCRCTVVQVLKSRYPATPHDEAMGLGEIALQRDTKGIFRFNPGKQEKAIPDYNPYTIRRCRDCDIAQGNSGKLAAFIPDNELCQACEIVNQCYRDKTKSESAIRRSHYLHQMEPLLQKTVTVKTNDHDIAVGFSRYGNKHLYSDTYGRSSVLIADDLSSLDSLLAKAEFVRKATNSKPRKDGIERFYYYEAELRGKKVYLNVAERDFTGKYGNILHERFLYSITDRLK